MGFRVVLNEYILPDGQVHYGQKLILRFLYLLMSIIPY